MYAIVLVGGFGTRLHPLTLTTPKQMLPVAGRPMLEHVVASLVSHGIRSVVLALGFKGDVFRNAYPDMRCAGAELTCVVEPEPLGTAGAIRFAWEAIGKPDETFLVVNGDVITDMDVSLLLEHHRRMQAQATIHLTQVDNPSRYGMVITDAEGRVRHFVEKPTEQAQKLTEQTEPTEQVEKPTGQAPLSRWINAGAYVMEPAVMNLIPAIKSSSRSSYQVPTSVERDTFPALARTGDLWAMRDLSYWIDAGTAKSYLQVQLDTFEGRRKSHIPVDTHGTIDTQRTLQRSAVAADAHIGSSSHIELSTVQSGALIGSQARVVRSVVMEDAVIGDSAVIEDSVVGTGAYIGRSAKLMNYTMIGARNKVDEHATLVGSQQASVR